MEKKFNDLEEKVEKSLDAILKSAIADGLKTQQLQNIFEKQINVLGFLVRHNKSKDKKLNEIITKYNTLSKKNFILDTKVFYEDVDLLNDDINYLGIYIRNIYKIDLDALIKGKKADIVQSSVSEVQQKDRGFGNKFGSFAMPGLGNMEGIPNESNPYFISLANIRLNDEIRKGNVYAFKSKPKLIPIFKYIIVTFSFLAMIACILIGIGMILSKDDMHPHDNGADFTWMGSFYFIFTICLGLIAYTILKPMLTLTPTKKKNDNFLYYFRWQNVIVSLGFFVLFILISSVSNDVNVFLIFSTTIPKTVNMWVWFCGLILLLISLASIIGLTIGSALLNPKSDRERMESIIKQYISEISSGKTPPPNPFA